MTIHVVLPVPAARRSLPRRPGTYFCGDTRIRTGATAFTVPVRLCVPTPDHYHVPVLGPSSLQSERTP